MPEFWLSVHRPNDRQPVSLSRTYRINGTVRFPAIHLPTILAPSVVLLNFPYVKIIDIARSFIDTIKELPVVIIRTRPKRIGPLSLFASAHSSSSGSGSSSSNSSRRSFLFRHCK